MKLASETIFIQFPFTGLSLCKAGPLVRSSSACAYLQSMHLFIIFVGSTGCRPYCGFLLFLLLLLLLLLQPLSRSALKHLYFHGSSIIFNILYIVGKRTAPGFIWWWLRQWQRHTQRQIRRQRQELSKASLPVYNMSSIILCYNKYI